jgi:hypothetical protein
MRSLGHVLEDVGTPSPALFLPPSQTWGKQLYSATHSCLYVLLCHRPKSMRPSKCRLKTLKPWAKRNLSFLQVNYPRYFITAMQSWLTQLAGRLWPVVAYFCAARKARQVVFFLVVLGIHPMVLTHDRQVLWAVFPTSKNGFYVLKVV